MNPKVYQFSNYTSDKSSSEAELKIDIPKGAIPAWSDCINKDQLGLSVYLREADENTATIEIRSWDTVSGHTETYTISEAGIDTEVVEIDL